jgi:tRNA-Thr(GGU) m(6)t(6)A37 methyltransferase TsaA
MKAPQDHTRAFEAVAPSFSMDPIAVARTPYKERYGTPHQATTTRGTREGVALEGTIELNPTIPIEALRGLEGFERLWVIYVFHMNEGWSAMVRPPRGPRIKRGVFATRSPHRPCPIGLSAVELIRVEGRSVHVRGLDLLDGTPVLDLKPYIPYADAFPRSRAGWVDEVDALEREAAAHAGPAAVGGSAAPSRTEPHEADARGRAQEPDEGSPFESGTP